MNGFFGTTFIIPCATRAWQFLKLHSCNVIDCITWKSHFMENYTSPVGHVTLQWTTLHDYSLYLSTECSCVHSTSFMIYAALTMLQSIAMGAWACERHGAILGADLLDIFFRCKLMSNAKLITTKKPTLAIFCFNWTCSGTNPFMSSCVSTADCRWAPFIVTVFFDQGRGRKLLFRKFGPSPVAESAVTDFHLWSLLTEIFFCSSLLSARFSSLKSRSCFSETNHL